MGLWPCSGWSSTPSILNLRPYLNQGVLHQHTAIYGWVGTLRFAHPTGCWFSIGIDGANIPYSKPGISLGRKAALED